MQKYNFNILWDFDGTLFNTYPAYTKIFKNILNDENVTEAEIYKELKISFRHAFHYFNISQDQLKEFILLEEKLNPMETPPFEGVEEILKSAEKNVIMTHKPKKDVLAILRHYHWEKYFSEIVAGDDGFPPKPNSASYEYLHKKHKINLVIGDREIDIMPGKTLGITTCLFQNKNPNIADFYLNHYQEFIYVVKVT